MEGAIYKKTRKLISLSEQNLVDCDPKSRGCNGGLEMFAFDLVKKHGVNTEEDYPYEGQQTTCRFNNFTRVLPITDYLEIRPGDEEALTNYLATKGPIPVGIDAGQRSFQHYDSGTYYDSNCKKWYANHSVLVVGYGSDKYGDFYIIKNSWGTDWGNKGYVVIARNQGNACGIATDATVPIA